MSPHAFVRVAAGLALSIFVGTHAEAQSPGPSRSYAVMYGGLSNTEVSAPAFGGSFGFSVTPDFQIIGEISRSQDVKAAFTSEDLALLDQGFSSFGVPFTSTVKMAVNYYSGGIKYLLPFGAVRPYVALTGGFAHMSPETTFTVFGQDVTSELMSAGMNTYFREDTRPMAAVGTGVLFTAGHLVFDAGYKYSAIFISTDYLQDPTSPHSHTTINTHQFTGGIGVRF